MRNSGAAREVVVVGRSCRLPGAPSVDQLWANLVAGRCSVTSVPADRWSLPKYGHPRPKEPGKSYVWAAGVIDDVWSFDPSVFGISPREAEQMDPQQRLMLELTWEALEDAGLTRAELAGTEVGVFVGASSTEYQNIRNGDIASGDAYTATGGALSIVSNRISHAFDFRGPSFTVDTACSSSLVALHQAMEALRSGQIDTAVVAGVNLLLSPFGFVVFSQASMLSPGGRCRTFDAKADGYVRAEGGVVLLLQTAAKAAKDDNRVHGRLVASGVNSDGRTNGIALPSRLSQGKLLQDVYRRAGIAPDYVAFVEAHGTGTRVGDPIEASTIGTVLGQGRSEPLRIGSIKSNIGHLEPASGLAGVLKVLLAFEHDLLPPSVNFDEPNPEIAFAELNLEVCTAPTPLKRGDRPRYAGVNSFGFGGTNAHIVISDAPPRPARPKRFAGNSDLLALSAASRPALRDLARRYGERLASATFEEAREVVAAAAHRREMLGERAVVTWGSPRELVRKLERIADKDDEVTGVTWGTVTEQNAPVAFVFSGNGGQWPGMGRGAYATNRRFRETFDEIDALFDQGFGWSITEALFSNDIEQRLRLTHIAQPLIFATQIATARSLAAEGLEPAFVLGHSVGEIAAAAVSGALTLRDAVRVIQARSAHQEIVRDAGRMAVLVSPRDVIAALCEEVGQAEIGEVEIAAENSPRTFTVAGTTAAVERLGKLARKRRIVFRQLDLDYPFHCGLIEPVREPLLRDLANLKSVPPRTEMISTVTGERVETPLDGEYWWQNVRAPVRFSTALERAAAAGARIFVEIGPRSVLLTNINETLSATAFPFASLGVLERDGAAEDRDPVRPAVISAFTQGAAIEVEKLLGPQPSRAVNLPHYPWHRRDFRVNESGEAVGFTLNTRWHRLAGARNTAEGVEWLGLLDTTALPELADHEIGGQAILPAAAFIEIALAVGREWFGSDNAALLEIDISQPLPLDPDRARETKARLSPATGTLEILSRSRMTRAAWTLHATARLTAGSDDPIAASLPAETGTTVPASDIYRASEAVGLRYGPAFRLLRSVTRIDARRLVADLLPSEPHGLYGLDPARLDACFHGLFALLGDLRAEGRGMAYIPVRFGHTRIVRPGAVPARALIEVTRAGEGSILADFTLFDAEGEAIAQLVDARFQAARIQRRTALADKAFATETVAIDRGAVGRPGAPVPASAILTAAGRHVAGEGEDARSVEQMLLEGWAAAAGMEIARSLGPTGRIAPDALAGLDAPAATWVAAILGSLAESGLATQDGEAWVLAEPDALPASSTILRTIASDHANRSAELLLAGRLIGGGSAASIATEAASPGTQDGYDLGGAAARAAGELIVTLLGEAGAIGPATQGLRILQVGFGPLSFALAAIAAENEARLTVLDTDLRRVERAKLALTGGHVSFAEGAGVLAGHVFDLVVSAEGLHRFERGSGSLSEIRALMAPGAVLAALEPTPSAFRDLVLGLSPGWFEAGASARPVGPLRSVEDWAGELSHCGFEGASAISIATAAEEAILLVADRPASLSAAETRHRSVLIRQDGRGPPPELATRLDALLALDGHDVRITDRVAPARPVAAGDTVIVFAAAPGSKGDVADLREGGLALMRAAESCGTAKAELWFVVQASRGRDIGSDPVAAGLVALARTLANENGGLTVRRVSIEAEMAPDAAAEALRALLASPQAETDITIGRDGTRALRVVTLDQASSGHAPAAPAARLERGQAGGLAGLGWRPAEHRRAAAGEVEIEVAATALNFRDVMWAMSLLPDDILEDGYAGPSLGLECAGTVIGVGAGVTRFQAGDRVLAFAPYAFSTHVAVPQGVVAPVPADWPTEAAAGVPVAFLTAYYGLVTLGGMKAGDWVLIHGAAGGVGLAAIQLAQWRGAHVIATAGSPEKRGMLRALGVEHVLSSRSTAFADEIRGIRAGGVDLVLNSLSGEAMERGLSTLRPFGRFIELGKRDYVANTRIGLRPFRRNLSYFGVDVDQLLSDRDRATEIFAEVMSLFDTGDLKPLPYRVFEATETLDAFRLMQQSGHVGKILLRPPEKPVPEPREASFRVDPDRTHVVTGGFGGFGLEAARWLADRGARHLVLVGRSGPQSEDAKALVDELGRRGVAVMARRCDVSDGRGLGRLFAEIEAEMPPIAGILHAAMVLDDGLVANLTADQLTRVLAPKVAGAAHLDRMTASMALDYFVLFSSITTFIGNPGQGAYVAANGYLEGLARLRRERGQPALALAWGAISDVGVLARQKGLAEALSKRVGVTAMPAREALDLMAQALADTSSGPERAVLAVGSLDWGAARRLPALASPTFAALTRDGSTVDASDRQSIDLRLLIASEPEEAVRRRVTDVIVEEIATVLRVPKQDVSPNKRLAEMGLDSLMAIELASALQDRFALDSPPGGSVGALTTVGLADQLIGFATAGQPDEEIRVTQALNDRHAGGGAIDLDALTPVMEAVTAKSRDLKGLMN